MIFVLKNISHTKKRKKFSLGNIKLARFSVDIGMGTFIHDLIYGSLMYVAQTIM